MFLLCIAPAFAAHVNITDCGNLDSSNTYYDVQNDLVFYSFSYANCLYATGQNQTIDCHGHSITADLTYNYGILADSNETTIENCVFLYPLNAAIYTENNNVVFHIYNNTFLNHNSSTCCDVNGNFGNDSISNISTFNDSTTGNYWGSPDGTLGFSDTCINIDNNAYCDSPYRLFADKELYDYFPLTTPVPPAVHGLLYNTLSDVGSGLGNFLDAITSPLAYILLIIGIIGGVLTIFFVVGVVIKGVLK